MNGYVIRVTNWKNKDDPRIYLDLSFTTEHVLRGYVLYPVLYANVIGDASTHETKEHAEEECVAIKRLFPYMKLEVVKLIECEDEEGHIKRTIEGEE